jgi:exo-beta-1,3-glucanase (GH17 family)
MRLVLVIVAAAIAVALNLALWALPNRPVALENPWQGPLPSVSFAPYRDGQSPLTRDYPSFAQIREDLRSLVGTAAAVRTYTSLEGLQVVPNLAKEAGLKVIQGAWLSNPEYNPDPQANAREIAALIKSANDHPDTVTRLIVGNEVLLRGDLPLPELIRYIRQVRKAVKQPVTYADVWEFWIKNPSLADEVDFITIHVLPYWENEPIGVDRVMTHIDWVYRHMKEAFPNKPIFIGEIGWPSAGRSRGDAVPGRVEQARFLNAVFHWAAERGVDFNVIEAFDQPWKSALEGTVGGTWGIEDTDRRVKWRLTEPIAPQPLWPVFFGVSTALFAAALVLWRRCLMDARPLGLLAFALLAQGAASAVAWSALVGWTQAFRTVTEVFAIGMTGLQALLALLFLGLAARLVGGRRPGPIGVAGTMDAVISFVDPVEAGEGDRAWRLARRSDLLHLASVLWALALTAILAINGRYWDFPIPHFLVATIGPVAIGLLALASGGTGGVSRLGFGRLWGPIAVARPARWLDALVAAALVAFALALVWTEKLPPDLKDWSWGQILSVPLDGKPWNHEALAWMACVLALAVPFAISAVTGPRSAPRD